MSASNGNVLDDLKLSTETLRKLVTSFQEEMTNGLKANPTTKSSLKMLHSFVAKPSGQEKGDYFALDLGGTNFRVIRLRLEGNGKIGESQKEQFTISQEAMTGTAEHLFDFITECVAKFVSGHSSASDKRLKLGFTFSFPVNQNGLAAGTLIKWTKGFTTSGVVGRDVVQLLTEAFHRKNLHVEVSALVNDTVGTMVACGYQDTRCEMGVILGTGTNACYAEKLSNIEGFQGNFHKDSMIINMEWGAFGDVNDVLPLTKMDREIDVNSVNPKNQRFEKMISGMYLGEIVRYTLLELIKEGKIFGGKVAQDSKLFTGYSFPTAFMTRIALDKSSDLSDVAALLKDQFSLDSTVEDRKLLSSVSELVATRAARLSTATIGAVLDRIGRLENSTVAVDGGVYEHLPGFRDVMLATLKELFPSSNVNLVLTRDGSGNGAAMIAATTD